MGGKPRITLVLGWREWVVLPELHHARIKAKVDTGAKTSALHAEDVRIVRRGSKRFARFSIRADDLAPYEVVAPLVGKRKIRSSNGHVERRPVIETKLLVGGRVKRVELTLTERHVMGFPMLLGRQAIKKLRAAVNPRLSFAAGESELNLGKPTNAAAAPATEAAPTAKLL